MKNLITRYTQFNHWANGKILDFLQGMPQENLDAEIVSSFPSLRKTVYHIWDAEILWLRRLEGVSLSAWPSKSFSGSFEEAAAVVRDCDQKLVDYARAADEEKLSTLLAYKNVKGEEFSNTIADILMHVVNHSTYHRGQIITMLRQTGHQSLFATDYIVYCREPAL
jgi:uncharacterized damage-inducible protein DinB